MSNSVYMPRATSNSEKMIMSLIVNPQFSNFIELKMYLVVNPQLKSQRSDILPILAELKFMYNQSTILI